MNTLNRNAWNLTKSFINWFGRLSLLILYYDLGFIEVK